MSKKLGKIIIYNAGFANRDESLTPTADLVCKRNPSLNIRPTYRDKIIVLDMDDYQENENGEYLFVNEKKEAKINRYLNSIINLSKKYPHKNIHVVTALSGPSSVDEVPLQIKRLKYILNYLKLQKKIKNPLILVGHSQGGLVNMETALTHHFMIERIISISTPYAMVTTAHDFLSLVPEKLALNLFKRLAPQLKDHKKYVDSVVYLSEPDHYDLMKERWNDIRELRPPLHIISGVCGKIESYRANLFPLQIQVTDGLVTLHEQTAIEYTTRDFFIHQNLECILDQSNQYLTGCLGCKRTCAFETLSLRNVVAKMGFNLIVNRNEINNFLEMSMHAIRSEENEGGHYQELYDLFSHDYSHASIRYCEETIDAIYRYISI